LQHLSAVRLEVVVKFASISAFVVASSETHMGLVETGVGLIPAGGGTKELTVRAFDKADKTGTPREHLLMQVAEII